jgi:hypothetical protein
MSDCPNHPSLTEEAAANTTEGFVVDVVLLRLQFLVIDRHENTR